MRRGGADPDPEPGPGEAVGAPWRASRRASPDALGIASLVVAAGDAAAVLSVVEEAIARAERLNPRLNAVVADGYPAARQEAAATSAGPLAAVPVLVASPEPGLTWTAACAPWVPPPSSPGSRPRSREAPTRGRRA